MPNGKRQIIVQGCDAQGQCISAMFTLNPRPTTPSLPGPFSRQPALPGNKPTSNGGMVLASNDWWHDVWAAFLKPRCWQQGRPVPISVGLQTREGNPVSPQQLQQKGVPAVGVDPEQYPHGLRSTQPGLVILGNVVRRQSGEAVFLAWVVTPDQTGMVSVKAVPGPTGWQVVSSVWV